MPKKYRSGFTRLSRYHDDTATRYATALLAVRENFTGFGTRDGYNPKRAGSLTDAQKRQIRRYYNLLSEYTEGGPVYKMKPSELPKEIKRGGKKNIDAVMRAAQMPKGRKRAKFIFVKYDGITPPKVRVRNGAPVFVNERMGYEKEIIELDSVSLAIDPESTIMAARDLVEGARFFRIINGRHEFFNAGDLPTVVRKIKELQQKYAIGTKDSWDRWLTGMAAYYSDTMDTRDIILHMKHARDEHRKRIDREIQRKRRARGRGK